MKPERLEFHSRRLLNLAEEKGTAVHKDYMSIAISNLSRYEREFSDIKNGVREQKDHLHHDRNNLRAAIRGTWQMIRSLERQITYGSHTRKDEIELEVMRQLLK